MDPDSRLRQIVFVARHYRGLKAGVARALWAPLVFALGVIEYLRPLSGIPGLVFGLANILGVSALGIWMWLRVGRWMDRRFGRVQASSQDALLQPWGATFWIAAYWMASVADDYALAGPGLPSAKFLVIAAGAAWCLVRRWPYAIHYLPVAAVALVAALQFPGQRDAEAFDAWVMTAFSTSLLAWTAAGLIDLVILLRALPRPAGEMADAATTSRSAHADTL